MNGLTPNELNIIHNFIRDLKEMLEAKHDISDEKEIEDILTRYREEIFQKIEQEYQWIGSYNVRNIVQKVRKKAVHALFEKERKEPVLTIRLDWLKKTAETGSTSEAMDEAVIGIAETSNYQSPSPNPIQWGAILRKIPAFIVLSFYAIFLVMSVVFNEVFSVEFTVSGILFGGIAAYGIYRYSNISPVSSLILFASFHFGFYFTLFLASIRMDFGDIVNFDQNPFTFGITVLLGIAVAWIYEGKSIEKLVLLMVSGYLFHIVDIFAAYAIALYAPFVAIPIMGWLPVIFTVVSQVIWKKGDIKLKNGMTWERVYLLFIAFLFIIEIAAALYLSNMPILYFFFFLSFFGTLLVVKAISYSASSANIAFYYLLVFHFIFGQFYTYYGFDAYDYGLMIFLLQFIVFIGILQIYDILVGHISKDNIYRSIAKNVVVFVPPLFMLFILIVAIFDIFYANYYYFYPIRSFIEMGIYLSPALAIILYIFRDHKVKPAFNNIISRLATNTTTDMATDPTISSQDQSTVHLSVNPQASKKYYKKIRLSVFFILSLISLLVSIGYVSYMVFYSEPFDSDIPDFLSLLSLGFFVAFLIEMVAKYVYFRNYRIVLDYWLLNQGLVSKSHLVQPIGNLDTHQVQRILASLVRDGAISIQQMEGTQ